VFLEQLIHKMSSKYLDLSNHIYFGTYKLTNEETLLNSLEYAYKYGYTKIDTATLYKNQHIIGQFLNTPDIKDNIILTETKKETQLDLKKYLKKRDKFWITSKVSFRIMPKGESEIRKSIDKTLSDLQTHYIDLMIIHSPERNDIMTWNILCEYKEKGLIRNIGLSNYNLEKLKTFIKQIDNPEAIYCNQIEFNPFLNRKDLIDYCKSLNIKVITYGNLYYTNYIIDSIADKMNKTKEQICARFALQKGLDIILMADEEKYIKMNMELDFVINEEDMNDIEEIREMGIDASKSKFKRFL
jgi:diketogulonate reductase-like aldo/keto reductase